MRGFTSFFKKEVQESLRSGKLVILGILFLLFGMMNPAIAKLTPWLMELFADSLAESGMVVSGVTVDAMTSWTQFFKNIPMALIVFLVMYGGSFTREWESGALIPPLTKGLSRDTVVGAKSLFLLSVWTVGYWLCFAVTYGYTAYYWDNGIIKGLAAAVSLWWLFGLFTICLTVLFSTVARQSSAVLIGVGGVVLVTYLLSLLPALQGWLPMSLTEGGKLMSGFETASSYGGAIAVTVLLSLGCLGGAVVLMRKRPL